MNQGVRTLVLFLAILCPACIAWADSTDLVQSVPSGQINWTRRAVEAKGIGTALPEVSNTPTGWEMAAMNAKRHAYINLLETVRHLRLSGRWQLGDVVEGNDQMMAKIEQSLKSAPIEDIVYSSDGAVEVTRSMPIGGSLAQLMLPEYIVQLEMKNIGRSSPDMEDADFTGLIVDARGVDVAPSMCFAIFDEGGREVYGSAYVSREFVVQRGMCGYATNMSAVEENERVGDNPLVVKALKAKPSGGTNIVISNTDASRLHSAVENLFFLRECRVIVVRRPFENEKAGPS